MKKFIKLLPILAIVAGISAALAFSAPKREHAQTQYWFTVDGNGNIGQYEPGGPSCPGEGILCAVAFGEQDVDISENPPKALIDNVSEAASGTDPEDSGVQIIAQDERAEP